MADTLVIQSHRSPLPHQWIACCLASVRDWCDLNHYEYRFVGDELFEFLSDEVKAKTAGRPVIASDLARLLAIRAALQEGIKRVVWLDADFLIFAPEKFILSKHSYAVGREVWVQLDGNHRLKVYKKVHNAFLLFQQENHFLDFYIESAERLLLQNSGSMPPQFIGPKLLSALHNVVGLSVLESAGMLSPLVIKEIINGGGEAVALFKRTSPQPITAANLCSSSCDGGDLSDDEMGRLIKRLLANNSNASMFE